MTVGELIPLLTKPNTRFVYLKKKVPAMTYTRMATALAEQNLYGVFRESDPIRTYPTGSLVGPIVGFVGGDGAGKAGLEMQAEHPAGRGRGPGGLRERAQRQQDPARQQQGHAGAERARLPADPGLRAAVGGPAAGGPAGGQDQGRLRLRHHHEPQDRRGPGAGAGADVRLERPEVIVEEEPQPAGGDGPVRARQRAEDPHLGGPDRLRHGRRRTPG